MSSDSIYFISWTSMIHQQCNAKPTLSSGVSVTLIYSYPAHVGPRKARAQLITYGALSARLPCWMSYRRVPFFSRCCLFLFSFFPSPFFFFSFPRLNSFTSSSFPTPTRYCPASRLISRSLASHQPRPILIRTSRSPFTPMPNYNAMKLPEQFADFDEAIFIVNRILLLNFIFWF